MTREEAIEIVKTQYSHDSVMKTALGMLIPELCESSDEIIRTAMIKGFNFLMEKREINTFAGTPIRNILAYLEKQKDAFENGRQFGIMQEQARQELELPNEKQEEQKPISFEEPTCEELEKELENYARLHPFEDSESYRSMIQLARHFTQWGAERERK